jgi:undecaprenyl-diphosphatase
MINELDTELFLWLNGHHAPWADAIMTWVTARNSWIPFYVILLGWIGWQYRRHAWGIVGSIFVTILTADQFTSSFLKPNIQRLRPCYVSELQNQIHNLGGCGGTYGFASSHAANSFGLAMILWLIFKDKHPAFRWVFVWAVLVSYSRIYVGVHYPLDILAGALVGIIAATMSYKIYLRLTLQRTLK